jgi:hypothetical protein
MLGIEGEYRNPGNPRRPVNVVVRHSVGCKDGGRGPDWRHEAAKMLGALFEPRGGRKAKRMPRVLSVEEERAQAERLGQRLRPVQKALAA